MKNRWILRIGFLLSFVFLFLVLKDFDLDKVSHILREVSVFYILMGSLIYLFSYGLRALRWKYFFEDDFSVDTKSAVGSFFIGNFGNNIFPARLGDVWRIIILHQRNDTPKSLVLGATIVERIFDAIAILISGIIAIFLSRIPSTFRWALMVLFLLVVIAFLVAWYLEEKYESKLNLHPKIVWFFKNLKLALKPLNTFKKFMLILSYTLVSWGIELFSFNYFLKAFGINSSLGLLTLILFFINIAVSIPSAPSNVGTFEYGFVLAGQLTGFDKSHIFTVALVVHFFRFIMNVIPGVIFSSLWHFKMKD
ncbi:MAG: lysylphosphatidylglycerol synthase transmembrane domain-containing protein [Candidatus Hydrothermia bacterium]